MIYNFKDPCQRTTCADGFSVSIQGNKNAYCTPRDDKGPYTHVELGFPSDVPPDYILDFAEDEANPTGTFYSWVPVPLVERMLQEHGGRITIAI